MLGLDVEDLLARYESEKPRPKARRIFVGKPKNSAPFASPIPGISKGKKKIIPRRIRLSRSNIILIVIIVAIIITGILIISNRKPDVGSPITNVTDVVNPDSAGEENTRLVSPLNKEDLTQEVRLKLGDINPAWALGRADSLTISVITREKTWILLETDYHRAFKGDIEPGDTISHRAKNAFFLTMGNPSAIHLSINGFDMQEWPERNFPMDLDINRGNILQLIEGSEKVNLPRPPRPNIIGRTQQEPADSTDSLATPPAIRVREPGTSLTDQNDNRRIRNVNTPPPEGPTGN